MPEGGQSDWQIRGNIPYQTGVASEERRLEQRVKQDAQNKKDAGNGHRQVSFPG